MMENLLLIRENIRGFYGKYSMVIKPLGRFAAMYSALLVMNDSIGFGEVANPLLLLAVSLIGAWLPTGLDIFLVGVVALLNLYSLSMEVMLAVGAMMVVMFCVNYAVRPEMNLLVLLLPVFHYLKIPYAVVLFVGMTGTLIELLPIVSGTLFYYVFTYIGKNANAFSATTSDELMQKFTQLLNGLMNHTEMWLMCVVLCVMFIVARIIGCLKLDYAKQIAPGAGLAAGVLVALIGIFTMDVRMSVVTLLLGAAGSALLAYVAQFMLLPLDYLQTEYVQFEDDEYYYYVKAVPKMAISRPDVQVKKLNIRKELENTSAIPEVSAVDITRELPELEER
ncbi:MAG: hypothetical protein IJA58_03080 [Lachnospiraceae bacterium]|nr:hypothetical protein [Lachnospiraceae bacterium]